MLLIKEKIKKKEEEEKRKEANVHFFPRACTRVTETFTSYCWLAIHSWGCFIIVHPFCRKQNTATYAMTFCDISRYEHLGSLVWQWQQSWQWFSSATYSLGICSRCLFVSFSSTTQFCFLPPPPPFLSSLSSPTQMLNTALLYFGLEDRIISTFISKLCVKHCTSSASKSSSQQKGRAFQLARGSTAARVGVIADIGWIWSSDVYSE